MDSDTLIPAIDAALRAGDHVDEIDEALIMPADLTQQQKAALWLYAFSRQRQRQQARMVHQQLADVGLA